MSQSYLLHQLLAEVANTEPSHEAVRCMGSSLTYGALDAASSALAGTLIDSGLQRGDRVGVLMTKRLESTTTFYAALKAGTPLVPLDPMGPVVRAGEVARSCSISALVATPTLASSLLPHLLADSLRLAVQVEDETGPANLPCASITFAQATAHQGTSGPRLRLIDEDFACIMYTSGSTGVPKGVMLSHRNVLAIASHLTRQADLGPQDRVLNSTAQHHVPTLITTFSAAAARSTLVLLPEPQTIFPQEILKTLQEERITVWMAVPPAIMMVVRSLSNPRDYPDLRLVMWGGGIFPSPQIREFARMIRRPRLMQLMGSTETIISSIQPLDTFPEGDAPVPLGEPIDNAQVLVLREDGAEAVAGEEGEVHVRGSVVFKGYWADPALTAKVLIPNPLDPGGRELIYRSGDIVRVRPDRNTEFLGRRDQQIKSRGYRIELGEIETILTGHPSIAEAVVLAIPHPEWQNAIVAYVIPERDVPLTETKVKADLGERLPRYMVPTRVEIRARLPHTSTGKIDRQRLLQEQLRAGPGGRPVRGFPSQSRSAKRSGRVAQNEY